jgi:SAM-dependent MidA family methyltransferase
MKRSLSDIIRRSIRRQGPISFRDFMEMALYYPELGYYTSSRDRIGTRGDYYTSPHLTHIYGCLIAKQLEEMWELLGKDEFTVVEYGAGMGLLCLDILKEIKNNKEFYEKIKYCIIEKSEVMRIKEQENIKSEIIGEGKVSWYSSINDIGEFNGCVLANEVLDNFSVHKVEMKAEGLMEVFVGYKKEFFEILKPAQDDLKDYFTRLNVTLPVGFKTEVNLQAIDWLKEISTSLKKGFVLTVDYGYPSSELYQSYRRLGTMICYNKHTVNDLPYNNIGDQDITAHVNFSALNLWGAKFGLTNCGFTKQSYFLSGLGLNELLRKVEEQSKDDNSLKEKVALLQALLLSIGKKLKVFIQQKGLDQPVLSGLNFRQPLA